MISKKTNILNRKIKKNFKDNKNSILENRKPVVYTKPRGKKRVKQNEIKENVTKEKEKDMEPSFFDQTIPRGLRELLKNRENCKKDPKSFLQIGQKPDDRGAKKQVAKVPKMIQGERESEQKFLWRIGAESKKAIEKSQLEKQFQTKLSTADDETEIKIKKSKKTKKSLRRLKEKKAQKLQSKLEKQADDVEYLKDKVRFGDVVKAPPVLTTKSLLKRPGLDAFQKLK